METTRQELAKVRTERNQQMVSLALAEGNSRETESLSSEVSKNHNLPAEGKLR